jgi:hypothetical protein
MTIGEVIRSVQGLRAPKEQTPGANEDWHQHADSLAFLSASLDGDVPAYIVDEAMFLYAALVPTEQFQGEYEADLLGWSFIVPAGYGWGGSFSQPVVIPELYGPFDGTRSATLDGGDPLFFLRPFEGVEGAPYIEINQRLSHLMGLHAMPDRKAWCVLSDMGEIVSAAQYRRVDGSGHAWGDGTCCTVRRRELDVLLYLTNSCLVRVFDFTRAQPWSAVNYGLPATEEIVRSPRTEVVARRTIYRADGVAHTSILRGFQVVRCGRRPEDMSLIITGREPREYATFIIWDWKHARVIEWSSAPSQLGNYFRESSLPYAISPAFFKPEVLTQYRQDPERYSIDPRLVRCRGVWQLRYDINREGLVHAYIGDLGDLPYAEQLRWKAFNVEPSGGISERAYQADFLAEWNEAYDPLYSLKEILRRFPTQDGDGRTCLIWRMPDLPKTQDIDFLGYVVTDARKEWEDQVLALCRILVDGLNAKLIRSLAKAHSCLDADLGPIKQLDRVLRAVGVDGEVREGIVSPLAEVQLLRSSKVAHTGGDVPTGDLRSHFRELLARCDGAMRSLADVVASGVLSTPVPP